MLRGKIFVSILVATLLLLIQVAAVSAAPPKQDPTPTSISGSVDSIALQTYPATGETIVVVTVTDGTGATHTYDLSLDTAFSLGLISYDPITGEPVISQDMLGQPITIEDPSLILSNPCDLPEGVNQPVAAALTAFFCSSGIDYQTIETYQHEGLGYGLIAQACWMADESNGALTCTQILDAKKSGDFSSIVLPDGTSVTNWGQLRKAALEDGLQNLGTVVSGNAVSSDNDVQSESQGNDAVGNHGNGNGNGHGNGHGNGKGGPHGNNGKGN